ncbi:ChrR family anti-sigma-E factor [Marinobacteraceae bacterium S3BR75-40.1]
MISHHPDENLLTDYCAGSLSEPRAMCIRLHLKYCSRCRSQVDLLNSLGAVMLEGQSRSHKEPAAETALKSEADEALFDSIMGRIEQEGEEPPRPRRVDEDILHKVLKVSYSELPWKKQLGDVSVYDLTDRLGTDKDRVTLQKLLPGGRAPQHTHRGDEMTIVLQGAFTDENGVFETGDFIILDKDHVHRPLALPGDDCITFSVLSAPVKLTGTFTRLLNPFIS